MTRKLEVHRFKDTGKWYETIEVEVPNVVQDFEAHLALAEIRRRRGDDMIWLMTGKGTGREVPRLILPDTPTATT